MRYLFPLIIATTFYGCQIPVALINAHEWGAFKLYKDSNVSHDTIRIDGFYYAPSTVDTGTNCLAFYGDGTFLCIDYSNAIGHQKLDSAYLVATFEELLSAKKPSFSIRSSMGVYRIKGDSILFQSFEYKEPGVFGKGAIYRWPVLNQVAKIKNDSTILLTNADCKYCFDTNIKGRYTFAPPKEFRFYSTNGNKPDSSKTFFNKKRWYKKAMAANK